MTTLNESLSDFSALVDRKTGIIRAVSIMRLGENDPPVFLAHADPCDTAPITGMRAANRGAACSVASDRALVRACGESIERYSSAIYDPRTLQLASLAELTQAGERAVAVHEIYPFDEREHDGPGFPYQRARAHTPIRWVRGQSLATDEPVWLPASCVYVPYLFDREVEPWTHMPISTGLAAGRSVEGCITKGIYEIIERDSLMITWLARIIPPRIRVESCRGFAADVDRLLAGATGGEWFINCLTLDVDVPVISAALIDPGDPPRTSFGIAASDDPVHALRLALEEAALTRTLVNRSPEVIEGKRNAGREERIDTLRGHLIAHAVSPRLRDCLRFMTDEGPTIELSSLIVERPPLEERLARCGLEALWFDVTTADLRSCGFHVTRTIIPTMQPLDNDHRFRYLGGARLRSVPPRFGRSVEEHGFNPDPHPFP